jgi:hypothetical protein
MKNVALLLNDMVKENVIGNYAVFGAVAQMRYTEAVVTLDVDILIDVSDDEGLASLSSIYTYCRDKGYYPEGEAIHVGNWPVQFIPVFSDLTREAVENADTADIDGIPFRVVRADYLAVIALSVGRAKDFARILALQESDAVKDKQIELLADRHGLSQNWKQFRKRFYDE